MGVPSAALPKSRLPYHGTDREAMRMRSRERHRIAVRHAADPCGEEGFVAGLKGACFRGARLPRLRPGRAVALPEVLQPLLRAQGPGPRCAWRCAPAAWRRAARGGACAGRPTPGRRVNANIVFASWDCGGNPGPKEDQEVGWEG